MTAVQFNNQQIKFYDFPKIHLDDIDERCGEVFITFNGTLVFHCSLCAYNYGSIDNFLGHLTTHYKDVQEDEKEEDEDDEVHEDEESDNDAKSGRSDSETLLKDNNSDVLCQEQKLFNVDVSDDDVNVNDVDVHVTDDIEEYAEILQSKEAVSWDWDNFEHIVAESKETDAEEIKYQIEIEDKTSDTWNLEDDNTRTNVKRRYPIKVGEFICKECGKKFRTNRYLKKHSIIHSDKRGFKCKICDFAFKDRANCNSHIRRCHLGTNKFECDYCPKKFFTQTEVRSHRRIHTGERYSCSICDKAYTTSNRLRIHNKRHTSEPTFKCSYCEKGFYEKFKYEDHILVHTKVKQFVCEFCAATFSRHKSLLQHSKLHQKSTK